MSKSFKDYQDKPLHVSEPGATSDVQTSGQHAPLLHESVSGRIMSSTMSVDEYFDELISSVRQDYAKL